MDEKSEHFTLLCVEGCRSREDVITKQPSPLLSLRLKTLQSLPACTHTTTPVPSIFSRKGFFDAERPHEPVGVSLGNNTEMGEKLRFNRTEPAEEQNTAQSTLYAREKNTSPISVG